VRRGYIVQRSFDLSGWTPIDVFVAETEIKTWSEPMPAATPVFYRLQEYQSGCQKKLLRGGWREALRRFRGRLPAPASTERCPPNRARRSGDDLGQLL
jgi:hypothetical protein